MNAQLLHVVAESLPASRKIYRSGSLHAHLRVPMREIELHASSGEPPLTVYDTSGPYTDPAVTLDIAKGLPRARAGWIAARGDAEAYPGRRVQPVDNGLAAGGKAATGVSGAARTAARAPWRCGHAARLRARRHHHA